MTDSATKTAITIHSIPDRPDAPSNGWFKFPNDIADQLWKLGPNATVVYLSLLRFAGQRSGCWPSVQLLARSTGLSRRCVQTALRKLETLRLIKREYRQGIVTMYHLTLPKGCAQNEVGGAHVVRPIKT